ncbi:MAG TPA: hypothetical protein VIL09_05345 [Microvirga sp.]|jgi:hypothetical protein
MLDGEINVAILDYLDATGGDPAEALRLAVEDLIRSQDEAATAVAALDRWTSRGYVQGRASERLAAIIGQSDGSCTCRTTEGSSCP